MSADSVVCNNPDHQTGIELKYPTEFLNLIETGSSLPDQEIKLKKSFRGHASTQRKTEL